MTLKLYEVRKEVKVSKITCYMTMNFSKFLYMQVES